MKNTNFQDRSTAGTPPWASRMPPGGSVRFGTGDIAETAPSAPQAESLPGFDRLITTHDLPPAAPVVKEEPKLKLPIGEILYPSEFVDPKEPPMMKKYRTASATFYNGLDDEFGSTTAHKNPDGKFEAIEGTTVAVDGKEIPFGKWIEVMYDDGTSKRFFTHDTGSAVKKKTASKGRGNTQPVLDFYTASKDLLGMNRKIGNNVRYRVLDESEI